MCFYQLAVCIACAKVIDGLEPCDDRIAQAPITEWYAVTNCLRGVNVYESVHVKCIADLAGSELVRNEKVDDVVSKLMTSAKVDAAVVKPTGTMSYWSPYDVMEQTKNRLLQPLITYGYDVYGGGEPPDVRDVYFKNKGRTNAPAIVVPKA